MASARIGVDLGGTKIEAVVLDVSGKAIAKKRISTPRGEYSAIVEALGQLVDSLIVESQQDLTGVPVGVGIPGTISPKTGLIKNANTTELIGHALDCDLQQRLGRPIKIANDANCFTLSETMSGAVVRAGFRPDVSTVFGVIVGTGVGGGIVVRGGLIEGPDQIAGEWGHNPLPWMSADEFPGRQCWCDKRGCIETFLSGPAMAHDHLLVTGRSNSAREIGEGVQALDAACLATLERYCNRLARALISVVHVLNPDAIVLGGGVSNIPIIYERVPAIWEQFAFSDEISTRLLKAEHGDSSGVIGAAWLWN